MKWSRKTEDAESNEYWSYFQQKVQAVKDWPDWKLRSVRSATKHQEFSKGRPPQGCVVDDRIPQTQVLDLPKKKHSK